MSRFVPVAPSLPTLALALALIACESPGTAPDEEPARPTPRAEQSAASASASSDSELSFAIDKGELSNRFVRDGDLAAHALTRSGRDPRIVAAFPAGNSGAGLWFRRTDQAVSLSFDSDPKPVRREKMRGVSFTVEADARELVVERVVASSVRVLRNYMHRNELPEAYEQNVEVSRERVRWSRTGVDGERRYALELAAAGGAARFERRDGAVVVRAGADGDTLRFTVEAVNDEPLLSAIPKRRLVNDRAADAPRLLHALAFLSYEEKLLAGSWRFLTYFGRDTLLSVELLMPVLRPVAVEAGLGSVLERLSENGEVAHEENVGEWAAIANRDTEARSGREPSYDYANIDDNLMLAPVAAHYLLDDERADRRARQFLNRETRRGRTYREALRANLSFVLDRARPYAEDPSVENLVALPEGHDDGNWRDSAEGLGGARIPYGVNVALMPAALRAAARLFESPHFDDADAAERARELSSAWRKTHRHFEVEIPAKEAKKRAVEYARSLDLKTGPVASAAPDEAVVFPSLALDGEGEPIPVMHSDDGFALLFAKPSPEKLERTAARITRPFPLGLKTGVGFVVANAAFGEPEMREKFTRNHYHGTTVWSWQQAMMAEGIARQLRRDDLPESTRNALRSAQKELWRLIRRTRDTANEELWSWSYDDGAYAVAPFGQQSGDITESNAAQLWSTVYLAVRPPEPNEPTD